MYLIRTGNEIHVCADGHILIEKKTLDTSADTISGHKRPAYVVVWTDGCTERHIAVLGDKKDAEDVVDIIWDFWRKDEAADIDC